MSDMQGKVVVDAVELEALRAYYTAGQKCVTCVEGGCFGTPCEECPTMKAESAAVETLQRIEEGRK